MSFDYRPMIAENIAFLFLARSDRRLTTTHREVSNGLHRIYEGDRFYHIDA